MKLTEIIKNLNSVAGQFTEACKQIDEQLFFHNAAPKWTIAQNVTHLITSAKTTRLAYTLPKFVVRLYTGKPNRPSRSYDSLVEKYKSKLAQGGRASGIFIPKKSDSHISKDILIASFSTTMSKLSNSMEKNYKDEQLDHYLCPHPLLGKITLRELGYFTIFHTLHHLQAINDRLTEFNASKSEIKA